VTFNKKGVGRTRLAGAKVSLMMTRELSDDDAKLDWKVTLEEGPDGVSFFDPWLRAAARNPNNSKLVEFVASLEKDRLHHVRLVATAPATRKGQSVVRIPLLQCFFITDKQQRRHANDCKSDRGIAEVANTAGLLREQVARQVVFRQRPRTDAAAAAASTAATGDAPSHGTNASDGDTSDDDQEDGETEFGDDAYSEGAGHEADQLEAEEYLTHALQAEAWHHLDEQSHTPTHTQRERERE
jgi:hypothetical protein